MALTHSQLVACRRYRKSEHGKAKRAAYKPRQRELFVKRKFGISVEEYEQRKRRQGPLCAICHEPMNGNWNSGREPHLDHDHKTGKLREFVHATCNKAIGLFGDDPAKCRAAAEYLEKHNG